MKLKQALQMFLEMGIDPFNDNVEKEVERLKSFKPCMDEVVCSNRVKVVNICVERVEEPGGVVGGDRWDWARIIDKFHDILIVK